MKEYEVLSEFVEGDLSSPFFTMHQAIADKAWDMLDLVVCREKIEHGLQALEIRKRFDKLHNQSSCKLKYSISYFELDGHKFETLDEVEKALKNKAFL